ncbi:MAG: 3-deoxy-D-manno-octulosonic acid transferase [Deltaproteobacteria bacterium]|nr:3-deoxy-D-manno-octulosonic acid transferase [Deltaproteobacteria bacterium]
MTKNAFILNFFKLYNMLWRLGLPFLKNNKRLKPGFRKRTASLHHTKADIWFQAASAGEAYLAVNILKKLSPETSLKILVTTTTSQGMEILKKNLTGNNTSKLINLKIEWFTFDMPDIIKKAVKTINPCIMVLLETEIWPALLYCLKQNRTKILIINARLSKKSFNNYMKTRFLWKHLAPDLILATSDRDAARYRQVFEQAKVNTMPNIKFESIGTDSHDPYTMVKIKKILPKTLPLTILASVRRPEEKQAGFILKDIFKTFPHQVVAVFPRHMHRIGSWEKLLKSHNFDFYLRSEITCPMESPGIILWDRFGELKAAYGFASVVFVGGSLKALGGQNFIEPAIEGAVAVTGPYYDDFAWATEDIFKKRIVIKKDNWKTIAETIFKALKTPEQKSDRKRRAHEFIESKKGGTQKACDEILKAFDEYI